MPITFDSVVKKIQADLLKLEELRSYADAYDLDDVHDRLLEIISDAEDAVEEEESEDDSDADDVEG